MGLLDGVFADVASTLTTLFSDVPRQFKRSTSTYDPLTGIESWVDVTAPILTTPPAPFRKEDIGSKIGDTTILATDLQVVIPRLHLEAAGFDIYLANGVRITGEHKNVEYQMLAVEDFNSGDEVAAVRVLLRK